MTDKKNNLNFLKGFDKLRFTKDKKQILIINSDSSETVSINSLYVLKMLFPAISLIKPNKKKDS
jgi:hypothetical protein